MSTNVARRSAMDTLACPPTLIPRSMAMYEATTRSLRSATREVQQPQLQCGVLCHGAAGAAPEHSDVGDERRHGQHRFPGEEHQTLVQGFVTPGRPGDVPTMQQVVRGPELIDGEARNVPGSGVVHHHLECAGSVEGGA